LAPSSVGPVGDLYSRAIAEKQMTSKLSLLNEHISRQVRMIAEMKVQNEGLQNSVLEYQRRYTNLKEQYEAEQEAWLSERVVLESKAKEQEDRKSIIASIRKSLQEVSIQLDETDAAFLKERQKLEIYIQKLETEKSEMKIQCAHFKEQQKMPKVLQRFGAPSSSSRTGHISMINSSAASTSIANVETTRRLESAERTIARLRADLQQAVEKQCAGSVAAVREAEQARAGAEYQMELLNEQLVQLNLFREQSELFRERCIEVDQMADREYKVWADEREDLLFRVEDSRYMVEQWCLRLAHREGNEYIKSEDIANEVVSEMERWRTSKQKFVSVQRRLCQFDYNQPQTDAPGLTPTTPLQMHTGYSSLSAVQRSTSMEGYRGSNWSLAGSYGVSPSLMRSSGFNQHQISRCGRSVSPDVSIRKITNYPDPTPGFLIRSNSRLGSIDSISSLNDVSQKPFTMPGKPPLRHPVSPARRKFFDESQKPEVPVQPPVPAQHPIVSKLVSSSPSGHERGSHTPEKSISSTKGESPRSSPIPIKVDPVVQVEPVKKKTPSVLSRISSKLTGSKSDLSKSEKSVDVKKSSFGSSSSTSTKSPGMIKKRFPSQESKSPTTPSKVKGSPEIGKKRSPERLPKSSPSSEKKSPSSRKKTSPEPTKETLSKSKTSNTQLLSERRASEMPKLTSVAATKTPVKTTRSNSTSAIAPSIMLLRQKFGGK